MKNNPKSLEDWKNIVTGSSDNFYKEKYYSLLIFQLETLLEGHWKCSSQNRKIINLFF